MLSESNHLLFEIMFKKDTQGQSNQNLLLQTFFNLKIFSLNSKISNEDKSWKFSHLFEHENKALRQF